MRACDVPRKQWQAWHEARERALTANDPGTAGLVRVAEADPRRLGVHAAIAAPGATGELPVYVERDTDTAVGGARALIQKAARGRGGLVVLVGGSSVGKTRCAYEAVRHLLPTWWLLHPAGTEQIHQLAAAPPPRLVVWLDELQHYLGGPTGLRASTVRSLLAQGAVLVATLWPERHRLYNALPQSGQSDPYAAEREVLSLADVVHIDSAFSPAERRRAHQAAKNGDTRIALALESASYGLTQTIAGASPLAPAVHGYSSFAVTGPISTEGVFALVTRRERRLGRCVTGDEPYPGRPAATRAAQQRRPVSAVQSAPSSAEVAPRPMNAASACR